MAAFSDSLSDRLYLCACLGALYLAAYMHNTSYYKVVEAIERCGMCDAIFTTLEQAMQVKRCVVVLHLFMITGCLTCSS